MLTKFSHGDLTLWHSIEKTRDERALAKRVSQGVRLLRAHAISQLSISEADAKKVIDGDWVRGTVFHKSIPGGKVTRIYDKKKTDNFLEVASNATDSGLTLHFAGQLAAINEVA